MASALVSAALARVTAQLPGGGEAREGQVRMAEAVADAITKGGHLVVQAGTGTGKSLGYLVPAVLSGSKVVVSTATKALQDQLANKDLPFLQAHLGERFAFAVLKGRSNYFCVQKAMELKVAGDNGQMRFGDDVDTGTGARAKERLVEEVTKIVEWAGTSETGDRAELDFEPSAAAWSAVSVSAGECPGAGKCPSGEMCLAEKARKEAAQSDVIVVNTHLYGQHVRSGGYVLPDHDVVIFDEAHEVEDIMADSLGLELSAGRFAFLAGRVRQVVVDLDKTVDLVDAGMRLEEALTPHAGKRLVDGPGAIPEVRRALVTGIERVNKALAALRNVPDGAGDGVGARKVRAVQAASALVNELIDASELGAVRAKPAAAASVPEGGEGDSRGDEPLAKETDARVAWVDQGSRTRGPVLRISPVEVALSLANTTWANTTAILTSATIPSNLRARLGLAADSTVEMNVGSPFDFANQGILYCARHLPDPRTPAYEPAMHDELEALLKAAGGRTLALFTSWRGMKAAADAMATRSLPFRVLTQSDLPKPALTKLFAEDETSCLFATMGFWQGIDVPGRALSLVVIDKLPFARPDEPLLVARRERVGAAAFRLIDVPRAAMLLAQGCGRLIRSSSDRGVVAVLDPRLSTQASYRNDLLDALPPFRRTRHFAEVAAFLATITAPIPAD